MKRTNAVSRVRKYFPEVNKVVDARESIRIEVTKRDSAQGRKKDPANCALAKACLRKPGVTGAIINVGYSYIVQGDLATRYKTSVGVGREITSFDRHQDFASGKDYLLSKVSECNMLGRKEGPSKGGPRLTTRPDNAIVIKHHTSKIRVARAD